MEDQTHTLLEAASHPSGQRRGTQGNTVNKIVKRPSFQFYPGDWLRSADLRSCSIGARGLWIDMICLMHEGSPYGYLKVGSKVILLPTLSQMVGLTTHEAEGYLSELKEAGVASVDDAGCLFSRRMVRDEKVRQARASGGILGGNPALTGHSKVSHKVGDKVNLDANLQPTPASAVASASASSIPKNKATNHFELPDWIPTEHWNAWIEARTKKRNAPTDYAKRLAVLKLDNLREQGHPPGQVLMQSAFNGWSGLFPPTPPRETK